MIEVGAQRADEDILRPLNDAEVSELFNLYKQKYGERNVHYLLMYNQLKWDRQLSGIANARIDNKWVSFRKTFYTHRHHDFRKYGTYVSLHMDLMQSVSFHSWEPHYRQLFECLRHTRLIDWSSGPLLTNVDLDYCEAIKQMAVEKGAQVKRARLCQALILPHENALRLPLTQPPLGYMMRPLKAEDAQLPHEQWVNNREGSLQYLRNIIEVSNTLGIVRQSDGKLIAWIFQNDFSGLGILQVQPEERRKGLGYILATQLSRQIAFSEAVDISVWILVENYKSAALLQKIGFTKLVENEWIQLQ